PERRVRFDVHGLIILSGAAYADAHERATKQREAKEESEPLSPFSNDGAMSDSSVKRLSA
ncbi:MAG: hypothetical protein ABI551_03545, partial [Polyangiaceae bacterium]